GLGLAFCKRTMLAFGGDIICESELEKYTRFTLLFPQLSNAESEQAHEMLRKKTILIVDDQEINLIVNKIEIEKTLSYVTCHVAQSGVEAIEMVQKNSYHLILMDIQMPGMDGIETTKEIKKFNRTIPVVAYSSLT